MKKKMYIYYQTLSAFSIYPLEVYVLVVVSNDNTSVATVVDEAPVGTDAVL
jgi:hypothetical protein